MADINRAPILRHLRRLAGTPEDTLMDAELLERFIRRDDRDAFAALVRRHGPLVWRVCCRLLPQVQDAEDAWQATFFVLARRAGAIRKPASLASWLHGAAFHIAQRARIAIDRQQRHERRAARRPVTDPGSEVAWQELGRIVEEEVHALAEKYRLPLLLCYWQDQTHEEAARRLGWPCGTVKTRLAKARRLLHDRLSRRGVTLPAGVVALLLAPEGTTARMPAAKALAALVVGNGSTSGGVSPRVAALADTGVKVMAMMKVKGVAVLILVVCTIAGTAALVHQRHAEGRVAEQLQGNPEAAARREGPAKSRMEKRSDRTDCYGDPLPPGAIQRLGTIRLRHGQWVECLTFGPDGKSLVSGGWDNVIRFWDPASGKELRRFEGHTRAVFGLAFSSEGKTLASAGNDGMIRVWDMASGQTRWKAKAHKGSMVRCVAISPDGKLLASGGDGNGSTTLVLWDLATGKELRKLGGDIRTVHAVAFSPDGKTLAAASGARNVLHNPRDQLGPGVARLWDVATGKLLHALDSHRGGVTSVAFSPDGKSLVTASHDNTICFWDAATGKRFRIIQVSEDPFTEVFQNYSGGNSQRIDWGGVLAATFSRDGKLLASAQHDGTVRLWQTNTGKELRTLRGHTHETACVAFSPDGKTLASGGYDNTIRLWDPASGKLLHTPVGHDGTVSHVVVFPDGKRAASAGGNDRTIRIWDLATGRELFVLRGHTKFILSLAVSPDGKILASGSEDKTIRVWDVESGRERGQIRGVARGAYALGFSPDGKLLAWADVALNGIDRKVSGPPIGLSELATGRQVRQLEAAGEYYGVRFSPDGKWLAGYAYSHGVDIRDVATGKRRHAFSDLIDFAFVPNADSMVGWCKDGMVRFRSLADGREIRSFQGPSRPNWVQRSFSISPDGRTLLFVQDNNIQLWETATGRMRRSFAGHASIINDCVLAPDGRTAVSASQDTTLLVWDVARKTEERPAVLTEKELESLWRNLAGSDAVVADRTIWTLAAGAEQAIPFLDKRLRPVPAVDPVRLARLLTDLDSDQFAARDKAKRELEEEGELAESALRKALANRPSLEARRRMEQLLDALKGPLTRPETIRTLRALEVLEHIGTSAARPILEKLAKGAAEANLTREAKASLERLKARRRRD